MAECTIVVPCYNEAQRLDLRAFIEYAARHDEAFLFVNDGSTDSTREVLEDLVAVNPETFSTLNMPVNRGKAEAVRLGMLQAFSRGSSYVGYWDADLATPLEAIADFRSHLNRHPHVELVMGARVQLLGRTINRRITRHLSGRLFATAAACVLRLPVYDTQCGAKLFRATDRVRSLFGQPFATGWIFDVELLARLLTAISPEGTPPEQLIHELPLSQWRDIAGSKVKFCDFLRAALQLSAIYRGYPALRHRGEKTSSPRPACPSPKAIAATDSRPHLPSAELERVR